jgi:hypothetical protein
MTQSEENVCFVPSDTFLDAFYPEGGTGAAASFTSDTADSVAMFSYRGPPAVADYSFTVRASGGTSSPRSDG